MWLGQAKGGKQVRSMEQEGAQQQQGGQALTVQHAARMGRDMGTGKSRTPQAAVSRVTAPSSGLPVQDTSQGLACAASGMTRRAPFGPAGAQ